MELSVWVMDPRHDGESTTKAGVRATSDYAGAAPGASAKIDTSWKKLDPAD